MKTRLFISISAILTLVMLVALPAGANVFMDENFEDASPFTDLDWPIKDNTTAPTAGQITANQGINVRSTDANTGNTSPKVVMNNSGTVSTTYAYSGSQSLELASGQSMAVNGNAAYCNAALNWYNVVQFAVTVDDATLALSSGTQVGHFKINWSTDDPQDPNTVEVVYQLNFVTNGSGGIDFVVDQGSALAGQIAGAGNWAMVSVLAQKEIANSVNDGLQNWEAYDPLTATYKGPQPTGDPFNNPSDTYAQLTDGIHVFVNSSTAANTLSAAALGNDWCNSPARSDDAKANDTFLLNWEIVAENSGTLFVDECYWSHGLHQTDKDVDPITQEGAARMSDFGTGQPPQQAEASTWTLYSQ